MKSINFLSVLVVGILISVSSSGQLSKSQAIDSLMMNVIDGDSLNFNVLLCHDLIQDSEYHLSGFHSLSCPYDSAWLFFVDMLPLAQWEHPCRYIFLDKITGNYTIIDFKLPPNHYWDYWERINYPFPYPEITIPAYSEQAVNYGFSPDPHKYAVFLCWNEEEPCRWNNMSHLYCGLKRNYGFLDDNIFVLSGSGNYQPNKKYNLDNDENDQDFDGPCTKDSLIEVFEYCKSSAKSAPVKL